MPHRSEQLESVLQRTIGQVLVTGMSDPRIKGLISVTGVKVSSNRREAIVSVSVLPAEYQNLTVKALSHAAPHIQSQVAKLIEIRQMPRFHFSVDESLKKQAGILGAISQALSATESESPDATSASEDASS